MTGRHESIKKFYRRKLEEHNYVLSSVLDSLKDSRIARLELLKSGDGSEFDTVEIEPINQEVPSLIQEAFERHTWLSQHCLSDVHIVKEPVEGDVTYALLVVGYVSDGWDGFCQLVEVFDEAGRCVGAAVCKKDFVWLNQPFDGDAFPGSPPFHWAGSTFVDENASWSMEKASRVEKEGAVTRLILPWAGFT